jgi:predicted amidohydrolase
MSTRRFVAAAVQLCSGSDKVANLEKAESFIAEAARHEAQFVVLPEVFLWRGRRSGEAEAAEPVPGPSTARLAEMARRFQVHLVAGSMLEQAPPGTGEQSKVYNTSVLFGPNGAILARYRKIHLFDVDISGGVSIRESDTRLHGEELAVASTALGKIGLSVCYDLRFPELYRGLVRAGAELIAVPSAFTFQTGAAHWEILVRARAIEGQVFVLAPNQIGRGPHGIVDFGNSMIVDAWGKPLARAADREMLIFAEIDRDDQDRVRRELPSLTHMRLQ